ncbi:hypothetical protein [Paraliomyxa miuraensis]|uniref:hypothetical protein n=1 Tax=Paraliomyxa miuraensis TaxID=376150 RepID=UPI002251BF73|nr:hypothetical protein [Paraliomyxa miuraensis]MCX4239426.1 hypothetical protein [Paraliomyxa miuraensis]
MLVSTRPDQLDRDSSTELWIVRFVDDAHAALAKHFAEDEAPDRAGRRLAPKQPRPYVFLLMVIVEAAWLYVGEPVRDLCIVEHELLASVPGLV